MTPNPGFKVMVLFKGECFVVQIGDQYGLAFEAA